MFRRVIVKYRSERRRSAILIPLENEFRFHLNNGEVAVCTKINTRTRKILHPSRRWFAGNIVRVGSKTVHVITIFIRDSNKAWNNGREETIDALLVLRVSLDKGTFPCSWLMGKFYEPNKSFRKSGSFNITPTCYFPMWRNKNKKDSMRPLTLQAKSSPIILRLNSFCIIKHTKRQFVSAIH